MKKKIVIALILAAVLLTAVLGAAACSKTELVGFDIELAKAVGEDLGVEVEFVQINWDTKENELESKNVDLLWNGMTITPEREAAWEISEPYMLNRQVAIIRKADADKFDTLDKMLASDKWSAENGSAGAELITDLGATLIGVTAQINVLTELNAEFDRILDDLTQKVYALAGEEFNINSPRQLAHILFEKLGFMVTDHEVKLYGLCRECRSEKINGKKL